MLTQNEIANIVAELASPIESTIAYKLAARALADFEKTGNPAAKASHDSQMMILTRGRAYRANLLAAHFAQLAA